jgi:hypothetical protein
MTQEVVWHEPVVGGDATHECLAEGGPPHSGNSPWWRFLPLALLMAAPASAEERTVIWQVTCEGESMSQKGTHAGE